MDASQANENELQKAIDDITSGAVAAQPSATNDVAAELEAKIQNQMGTPPAPEAPAGMAMPPVPDSSVEAMNPEAVAEAPAIVGSGAPVAAEEPASEAEDVPVTVGVGAPTAETPAAEEPAEPAPVAPAVEESPAASGNLSEVKQAMLRDLFPLMDKVELAPEQKYDVYKEMIESTGDKEMIPAAYEAVKGIADETAKAEALLYLVDKAE